MSDATTTIIRAEGPSILRVGFDLRRSPRSVKMRRTIWPNISFACSVVRGQRSLSGIILVRIDPTLPILRFATANHGQSREQ